MGQTSNDELWRKRIHKEDVELVHAKMMETINNPNKTAWSQEYRYYKADGEIAYVSDRSVVIRNSHGKAIKMVGSMQDITERKKIENERESIIEELTTINNDLKQFSFITSHNLRAPLSNILGLLDVVDKENLNSTNQQFFQMLQTCSGQLKDTIEDLTEMIVIRNKAPREVELVNLETTFKEVREVYLNNVDDIAHNLTTDFQLMEAALSKPYLSSIFTNLLSNAIKYRSPERVLTIHVSSKQDEEECVIRFGDNGLGMDTNRLKNRLFGMYQRFHENVEGKGLGLFIVKSQVNAMGGNITVESEVNKGTTFTLKLPMKNR
jgi:signal transduction histidine kinase